MRWRCTIGKSSWWAPAAAIRATWRQHCGRFARDIDAGNYVAAVGSLDNAVEVLKMIKETRIDGKAILYPHIRPTPLRFVEHWGVEDEKTLLAERLNG